MRAAWLGSWKAPWGLGRGRRWGDLPWALSALGQAWLMGGQEGRWPRVDWEARLPFGPRPSGEVRSWGRRPEAAWVALLRHGRAQANPLAEGEDDSPCLHRAWEGLLEGDALPLLCLGTALLDRRTRAAWIPLLGAVEPDGTLRLPPFLEPLVPSAFRPLPPGWWEDLLGRMDSEGRLLPLGPPHPAIGQIDLGLLEPFSLPEAPAILGAHPGLGRQVAPGHWMLAPFLRGWGRGWGPTPEVLAHLVPAGLAHGDAPEPGLDLLLQGKIPSAPWEGWMEALHSEFGARAPFALPARTGHPTWDRLRAYWGGSLPKAATPGYPLGTDPHPCADPFHWLAAGQHHLRLQEPGPAHDHFGRAHAHFLSQRARTWAERAAQLAGACALELGDLVTHERWHRLSGRSAPAQLRLETGRALTHPEGAPGALEAARALLRKDPRHPQAWAFLGDHGLASRDRSLVEEALAQVRDPARRSLYEAFLSAELPPSPGEPSTPETRIQWARLAFRAGRWTAEQVFGTFEACANRLLHLEVGLEVLEADPEARTPQRLLQLQSIAKRAGAEPAFLRLCSFWPRLPAWPEEPEPILARAQALLRGSGLPIRVIWGELSPQVLGAGEAPPEGLIEMAFRDQELPPLQVGGRVWISHRLTWEGAAVGVVLVGLDPAEDLHLPPWLPLLAPWVARLAAQPAEAEATRVEGQLLLTDGSEPMASLLKTLNQVAPSRLPVVLLGPSGTGKELAAREIHQRSGRTGKWVPVNCAAYAEGVLESELFGHVKGAYTGASRDRQGQLETASGGTLFLDEVADLSPRLQSLLLRALQEGEIQRVGSDRVIRVDLRIVAATHKDLEGMVATGAFRADLWYRLQGSVLRMPPLAHRRHELPWLLPRIAAQVAREGGLPLPELAPGLARSLAQLPWPGNIRELRHALHRAMLRAGHEPLAPRHFPELEIPTSEADSWASATRRFQRELLLDSLRAHGHQVSEVARALGLARPALYATAKRLGLDLSEQRRRS
ncbi:MAG: sigma-54-dependent Fis family transcriptional regulator [Acidobacteria bacterium]|nr:sigma-54-dependent Fis family transcriptional regulator [Acidobacteriota bacterium]